ncbi:MAG: helix-turn-helix transcriptional regulator [Phycisphaerales bacterium]|nr:MAG: helix-turn-helix transcriptional regulator [Phycisphaerales bacterium]
MRTQPKNDLADLIRARFRESGLSIKQLAERAGVPYASVHGFTVGTRDPVLSTVSKLCKVLGLELRSKRRK